MNRHCSNGHDRKVLRLHQGHAGDGGHCGKKLSLGREGSLPPCAERISGQRYDHLEVMATAADDPLDALEARDRLQGGGVGVKNLLDLGQRRFVPILAPLHPPLTRDGVEGDSSNDFTHVGLA
eukprot:CAMPEP_0173247266 /NCGR_PEP_ID=MMETSP1142-20121109/17798_1 /TAXON_ID=483371 /ORGANISM="non described non described, Strain CCMP2298" /LENGTH=122 /DNA_ID=CAMNT_0014179623 /DNA_START=100 /DNA_END=464 /DNA_ORIENTATION=+